MKSTETKGYDVEFNEEELEYLELRMKQTILNGESLIAINQFNFGSFTVEDVKREMSLANSILEKVRKM